MQIHGQVVMDRDLLERVRQPAQVRARAVFWGMAGVIAVGWLVARLLWPGTALVWLFPALMLVAISEAKLLLAQRKIRAALGAPWTYTLADEALDVRTPLAGASFPWPTVRSVRESTDAFLLTVHGGNVMPLPKAAFTAAQVDEIRTFLAQRQTAASAGNGSRLSSAAGHQWEVRGSLEVDWWTLAWLQRRRSRRGAWFCWIFAGTMLAGCLLPLALMTGADGAWPVIAAYVGIIAAPELMVQLRVLAARPALGPWEYRVTRESLVEEMPVGAVLLPWATVTSAREQSKFFVFRAQARPMVLLPKKAFSAEEIVQIRALLQERQLLRG